MSGKVIAAAIAIAVGAFFAFWVQYRIRKTNGRHGYGRAPPLQPPPSQPPQHPPVARRSKRTRTRKLPKKADDCVICMDSLSNNVEKLPCGHSFHSNCIQRWLQEGEECPYRCYNKKVI